MNTVIHSSFQSSGQRLPHLKVRPIVAIWALVVIILCSSLAIGSQHVASLYQHENVAGDNVQPSKQPAKVPNALAVTNTPPALQPSVTTSMQVTAQTESCSPYSGASIATALSLFAAPDGLTKKIDDPSTYKIYGNSANVLRTQIRQCAPKQDGGDTATFTAQTTYKLTWQYSYVGQSDGMCKITHAKVGIHVMQIMPSWQTTSSVQPGLVSQWQSFMSALTVHENGHTALDLQYAQTLLDDLNNFPATACGQLAQSVKHLTDYDVATLNQANDNYDSSTNHGATQGAILP